MRCITEVFYESDDIDEFLERIDALSDDSECIKRCMKKK